MAFYREHQAFDGQVTIHILPYIPQQYWDMLASLTAAYPHDLEDAPDSYKALTSLGGKLNHYCWVFCRVYGMEFKLDPSKSQPELEALKTWWTDYGSGTDYAQAFKQKQRMLPHSVTNAIIEAFNKYANITEDSATPQPEAVNSNDSAS